LFSEAIKDRLRPKTSAEKARLEAFALYELLGDLNTLTDRFVIALRSFADALRNNPVRSQDVASVHANRASLGEERVQAARRELDDVCDDLLETLFEVPGALSRLYPQLTIHYPDLVDLLDEYTGERTILIEEVQAERWKRAIQDSVLEGVAAEAAVPERYLYQKAVTPGELEELDRLVNRAEENSLRIKLVTEDMRTFLAREFPFKESF